jgi:hypothetical protein
MRDCGVGVQFDGHRMSPTDIVVTVYNCTVSSLGNHASIILRFAIDSFIMSRVGVCVCLYAHAVWIGNWIY